jgi:hypothetical protein
VNVEFSFESLVPEYAKGYFGQSNITSQGTVPIDLFSQFTCEQFFIDDVQMDLTLNNGLGADVSCTMEKISMVGSQTGSEILLQHALIGSNVQLSRAMEVPYTLQSKKYNVNAGNSNITQLLSSLPKEFRYSIRAMLNPLGNVSSSNDFLLMPRILDADVSIAIPMRLGIKNLMYHSGPSASEFSPDKATGFRLGISESNTDHIRSAHMQLKFSNTFPLSFRFEPCFFDENNQPLQLSFLVNQPAGGRFVMHPAIPEADGKVLVPAQTTVEWEVTGDDLKKLLGARKMAYRLYLNSIDANGKYHLWYDNYKVDFSLYSRLDYVMEVR